MDERPGRPIDDLIPLAEAQDGYFLASQAAEQGVDRRTLVRLERAGDLDRERWGLYRLARWPAPAQGELWPAILWARVRDPEARFSHRTALWMHGVSDINPTKVDLALRPEVRLRSEVPPEFEIHRR
ncbi:MAG TPA: type IV toxin-antitoxin system AbiEi family antitoxin domain-containing protein, partial [Candidatus Acidoferrales bacterium]|nr:type IV toxin-antitoxin system AbiEi family antitoxin domain-containing protein [Candidatus Acidoferrales bacterium]